RLSRILFGDDGQNSVEPSGKRTVRTSQRQSDYSGSQDRGNNHEGAYRPSHSEHLSEFESGGHLRTNKII
ncbi:MAG: hypothetical protein E6417_39995, partial [Bradyrhizobium sp.]|nr:hypothetical protein [Bradyrhizobium sp.]